MLILFTITKERNKDMLPKNREPTHPGVMLLEEFLKPLEISQKEFAKRLGWTYARLNKIINGRRGVNADSALSFADAFNMEPKFWLNLQRDWDLWHAVRTHKKIKAIFKSAA
jgi:addiction module HigA family antidote